MKRTADISDFLHPLRDKPYQAYLSNALQVADVLDWVLQQLGKSEVWQTSFSISEEFIRRLFFIEKSGLVTRFNLVLDHKATNKTLKLWAFITQVINTTYLADNHSKVLLVRSEKGEVVSIITSQNLTRGNRCESAVVTTDLNIFNTLHGQIQDLIKNHSVPLNELFERRIAAD
ncbi:MAG: C4-dicarboxylate ABC transporter [Muribaculaceae bacterium]|nr:C4-dicarboxylate ABC transporter [Muribaculaceae bacterium]